jgi:hypothetical protein
MEQVILDHLNELEHLRKMLVTNKQQKKTAIREIRRIRSSIRRGSQPVQASTDVNEPFDCLLEYESPEIKDLNQFVETLKQNHRTNARKLCEQANRILLVLRTRDILAYKMAAENTIGAIIHHAEKCRTFIAHCRYIAGIEYCAYAWWMETQKDPMDHSPYYVTAFLEDESTRYRSDSQYPRIRVVIRSSVDNSAVFCEYMNQELADTILTDDAIRAFESEDANYEITSNIIHHPEHDNDDNADIGDCDCDGDGDDYYSD